MIVVTGGAGFIGANLIKALNEQGHRDILIVDRLTPEKVANVASLDFEDFIGSGEFHTIVRAEANTVSALDARLSTPITRLFHQGACSDTMVADGEFVLKNNYSFSRDLLHWTQRRQVDFIYASSASVYGAGERFIEQRDTENPLNLYALSKWMFDQYVRQMKSLNSRVVGLRYFNVYGPRESHKGRMASVAWHFSNQYRDAGYVQLFSGTDGYADGEQRRDFVYVDDVVNVNLWLAEHPHVHGVFNVGTGRSQSFNDVAAAVVNAWMASPDPGNDSAPAQNPHAKTVSTKTLAQLVDDQLIRYIPFPDDLKGKYQSFTQADITALRSAGYAQPFASVEQGVGRYVEWLANG